MNIFSTEQMITVTVYNSWQGFSHVIVTTPKQKILAKEPNNSPDTASKTVKTYCILSCHWKHKYLPISLQRVFRVKNIGRKIRIILEDGVMDGRRGFFLNHWSRSSHHPSSVNVFYAYFVLLSFHRADGVIYLQQQAAHNQFNQVYL